MTTSTRARNTRRAATRKKSNKTSKGSLPQKHPQPNNINKKFANQIRQFKEYQTAPTKAKFDKLFNDNLGLVTFVVNRWFNHAVFASKRDDMIQEGSIGLMSAIRKFNPDLDKKFSPYAILWVKQAIVKYILTDKTVKLPVPLMSAIKKYNENPEAFELDQTDPEKANTKGFNEMLQRYKVQRFDMSLDEELPSRFDNSQAVTYKDLLVTNIDNSYSGSVCDGTGAPFSEATNLAQGVDPGSFTNYEFDNENAGEFAGYVDALARLSRKDAVVVALRYGFSEGEAVVFADMLQAMEEVAAAERLEQLTFAGLRHFPPVEKRSERKAALQDGPGGKVRKRKYITRKEENAVDFRTISSIVKEMGFARVNHATARNIVNSRLYDLAVVLNERRSTAEPCEAKKLSEDQIKSIILTSPEFHTRFAEVLKGSYAYLLKKKREQGDNNNEI